MKSLTAWLETFSPDELAAVVAQRPEAFLGAEPRSLEDLGTRLVSFYSVNAGLTALTKPGHHIMSAAARCAVEAVPATGNSWPGQQRAGSLAHADGSAAGVVVVDELLASIGAGRPGESREAAWQVLAHLKRQILLWPHDEGRLGVPGVLMRLYRNGPIDRMVNLDRILTERYNKAPVAVIAQTLGLGVETDIRPVLQSRIVDFLTDGPKVRELVRSAPAETRQLFEQILTSSGAVVGTRIFRLENQYTDKVTIDLSYPDRNTVWLVTRGLLVPIADDRAGVPAEVAAQLHDGARYPFAPRPPALPTTAVPDATVEGEAQAALLAALATMSKLLDAIDRQPLVPRKTGGLPVREARRLGKLLGTTESVTCFWTDLACHAGLVGFEPTGSGPVLCPTSKFDDWRAGSTAARLALILRTWLAVDDVITWWPDQTPVVLGMAHNPFVARARAAVLGVLAGQPAGVGVLHATPLVAADTSRSDYVDDQLAALTAAAVWHAPISLGHLEDAPTQVLLTIYEAELLGVAAHGALTGVGRALRTGNESALIEAISALLPQERATARFQADMTVVVAGTPSPELAALLGSVAERESEGHAVVYRITAANVRQALDAGVTAAELLARLREAAEGTLPQTLEYLVTETGRAHGRIRVVRSACCLRCDDASLLAELVAARSLAKLGLRQIAPTVAISVMPPAETLAALRAAGYSPALEGETGTTVVERTSGRRAPVSDSPVGHSVSAALAMVQRVLGRARQPGLPL